MLSTEEISKLKSDYGSIYSVSVAGVDVVFRPLTMNELDLVVNMGDSGFTAPEVEDFIVESAIVWPKDIDLENDFSAGSVTSLAESIMSESTVSEPDDLTQLLETSRDKGRTLRGMMKSIILSVQPAYTEEDLNDLTFVQLVEKVVLSEQIIEIHQAIMSGNEVRVEVTVEEGEPSEGAPAGIDPIAQKLHEGLG